MPDSYQIEYKIISMVVLVVANIVLKAARQQPHHKILSLTRTRHLTCTNWRVQINLIIDPHETR